MEYKGYTAKVDYDDEAGLFHGQVLNLRDVITFQGTSVEALRHEFRVSVDDYLEWCNERGEAPEKPFSGKFVVRLEPSLHRDIATRAELTGKSLNTWVAEALAQALETPKHKLEPQPVVKAFAATEVSVRAVTQPLTLSGFEPSRAPSSFNTIRRGHFN